MTSALAALDHLGLVGLALILAWVVFIGYWATRPLRPEATWYSDLARLRNHLHRRRNGRQQRRVLVMGLPWWPRAEVGPRMWRWPLNTTRWITAGLWHLTVRPRPGLLGLVTLTARLAWYPAAGIGALAAIAQALVLMTIITLPMTVVLVVIDSATVLRGGYPPVRHNKAAVIHQRRTDAATVRLAEIRTHLEHEHQRYAA